MGLAEVRAAITRNAVKEAEAILAQARIESEAIVRAAKERVKAERAAFDTETAAIIEILERRATSEANARAKAVILNAKRRALEQVYAAARENLTHLGGPQRSALITSLCASVKSDGIVARVRAAPHDATAIAKALPDAAVAIDENISGGFVATSADGSIAVDRTFDTILADTYEKELVNVSRILFGTNTENSVNDKKSADQDDTKDADSKKQPRTRARKQQA